MTPTPVYVALGFDLSGPAFRRRPHTYARDIVSHQIGRGRHDPVPTDNGLSRIQAHISSDPVFIQHFEPRVRRRVKQCQPDMVWADMIITALRTYPLGLLDYAELAVSQGERNVSWLDTPQRWEQSLKVPAKPTEPHP